MARLQHLQFVLVCFAMTEDAQSKKFPTVPYAFLKRHLVQDLMGRM